MSKFLRGGPSRLPLASSPRNPICPSLGNVKHEGLYHCVAFPPAVALCGVQPGAKLTRSVAPLMAVKPAEPKLRSWDMENGKPLIIVTIPLHCHPSMSLFPWNGKVYSPLMVKLCLLSKVEFP